MNVWYKNTTNMTQIMLSSIFFFLLILTLIQLKTFPFSSNRCWAFSIQKFPSRVSYNNISWSSIFCFRKTFHCVANFHKRKQVLEPLMCARAISTLLVNKHNYSMWNERKVSFDEIAFFFVFFVCVFSIFCNIMIIWTHCGWNEWNVYIHSLSVSCPIISFINSLVIGMDCVNEIFGFHGDRKNNLIWQADR